PFTRPGNRGHTRYCGGVHHIHPVCGGQGVSSPFVYTHWKELCALVFGGVSTVCTLISGRESTLGSGQTLTRVWHWRPTARGGLCGLTPRRWQSTSGARSPSRAPPMKGPRAATTANPTDACPV